MKNFFIVIVSFLLAFTLFATESFEKELVLTSDNTLVLSEDFNSRSIGKLMQTASKMDLDLPTDYPMILVLYTPGGSIQDGLELFEFFKGLNRPIHTLTIFSASMGFQAVQSLGNRYILNYGTLMSHKARGGFEGEFGGDASQLDSRYGLWLRKLKELDLQTVRRTEGKQTLQSYRAAYSNELWLNGWEAVEQGYADVVVTARCDKSLKGKTVKKPFNYMGYSLIIQLDACPLNQNILGAELAVYTNQGKMNLQDFINKSGKFGPDCVRNEVKKQETSGIYGTQITYIKVKPELCAANPNLTLKEITDTEEDIVKRMSRDLRFNIQYSY